ncbi:MAG TPA: basic secretory protein-like protein [Polyangiaceae bacterium]|nr:basic secretory protein-like protein [Polyangiaceae bacterium]
MNQGNQGQYRWVVCGVLALWGCGAADQQDAPVMGTPVGGGGAATATGGSAGSAMVGGNASSVAGAGGSVGGGGTSAGVAGATSSAGAGGATGGGGVGGSSEGGSAGAAGSGGNAGSAGAGGSGGSADNSNPMDCLPAFEEVCGPDIVFDNQDPDNSGNFDAVITDVETTMKWAACTVCSIMYRTPEEVARTHDTITFVIDNHDGVAYAGGSEIHLSTGHIQNYPNADDALIEFRGVMVHETAHLYQTNGGNSDGALIEGMADFVRVRAGYYGPGRCGGGDSWDGAYTISGCFFSWLAGPCDYHDQHHPQNDLDIGYRINAIMSDGKSAIQQEIETTFGSDITTLWTQYKADQ